LNRRCDWRRRVVFAEMKVAEMCAPNSTDTPPFMSTYNLSGKNLLIQHPIGVDFGGQPGVHSPIFETRLCIYQFLPHFPLYLGLPHQYF